MITNLKKWGNGQGLRISKELMKMLGIDSIEEEIKVEVIDRKIVIEKAERQITIDTLFEDYKGEYKPSEYDCGETKGREIW